jgi:hypothetical protein
VVKGNLKCEQVKKDFGIEKFFVVVNIEKTYTITLAKLNTEMQHGIITQQQYNNVNSTFKIL